MELLVEERGADARAAFDEALEAVAVQRQQAHVLRHRDIEERPGLLGGRS